MFNEEENTGTNPPLSAAQRAFKNMILHAVMWISAIITMIIAYHMQSWWPFAGWLVVMVAFALWLGD